MEKRASFSTKGVTALQNNSCEQHKKVLKTRQESLEYRNNCITLRFPEKVLINITYPYMHITVLPQKKR